MAQKHLVATNFCAPIRAPWNNGNSSEAGPFSKGICHGVSESMRPIADDSGCALLCLSEDDVRRLLDPAQLVEALAAAFARDYRATVQMPTRLQMPNAHGVLLLMPCSDSANPAMGFKSVFV